MVANLGWIREAVRGPGRQSGCNTQGNVGGGPWAPLEGVSQEELEARPQKTDSHFLQNLGKQRPLGPRFCAPSTFGLVCKRSKVRGRHLSLYRRVALACGLEQVLSPLNPNERNTAHLIGGEGNQVGTEPAPSL